MLKRTECSSRTGHFWCRQPLMKNNTIKLKVCEFVERGPVTRHERFNIKNKININYKPKTKHITKSKPYFNKRFNKQQQM